LRRSKILELVNVKVSGTMTTPSLAGTKYFFLFVDAFSQKLYVFLLKKTLHALGALKEI
jgi:hypothetical protein